MSQARPVTIWSPDPDARSWLDAGLGEDFASVEEAIDGLSGDPRVAAEGDGYCVVWDPDRGYLAATADPDLLPEPAEILCEDEQRYYDGDLEERPLLHGADGPDGPWQAGYEDDRYDEIQE